VVKIGFGLLVDTIFFAKGFGSVFELPSLKNTRKCDKTKKVEEKLTSKFCQNIFMVFSNSPCRKTPKNVLKKQPLKKKKKREVPTYLIYHLPDVRRFHFFFFGAPRTGISSNTREVAVYARDLAPPPPRRWRWETRRRAALRAASTW
jgi:hypothetical protein